MIGRLWQVLHIPYSVYSSAAVVREAKQLQTPDEGCLFAYTQKQHSATIHCAYNEWLQNTSSPYIEGMSLVVRTPVFRVSDKVRHKLGLGCRATEDRLKVSDLGSGGIVLSI